MPCFPGVLLRYFLDDFETVLFAPVITGITLVFTFCVLQNFSAPLSIAFLSVDIAISFNRHVRFSQ